jgi:hypothetical protein
LISSIATPFKTRNAKWKISKTPNIEEPFTALSPGDHAQSAPRRKQEIFSNAGAPCPLFFFLFLVVGI